MPEHTSGKYVRRILIGNRKLSTPHFFLIDAFQVEITSPVEIINLMIPRILYKPRFVFNVSSVKKLS